MAETGTRNDTITARHQQLLALFNRRDWDTMRSHLASDVVYTDHARSITAHGPDEVVEFYRIWAEAFPDAAIGGEGTLFDQAGSVSISRFVGRGEQDGPLGPFEPSGRYAETAFCEVLRFDGDGRVAAGDLYYDQLSMLQQLGHIPTSTGS